MHRDHCNFRVSSDDSRRKRCERLIRLDRSRTMAKIIIEAAINGAVAKKTLNPNFAYSPQEIADDAIATCEAGAAIVHFHARQPETGELVFEHGELYTEAYPRPRAKTKATRV